jgi:N-hydroxyarylamine O-acetyltransferase
VQQLLVVLHNPKGRETLLGYMLKTVTEGRVEKQTIRPEEIEAILSRKFGL